MGTIRITEYTTVGGQGAVGDAPAVNLSTSLVTTVDATTSTTAESLTLNPDTRFITVHGVEDHRISLKNATVTDQYEFIGAAVKEGFPVNKEDRTLYYRLDA